MDKKDGFEMIQEGLALAARGVETIFKDIIFEIIKVLEPICELIRELFKEKKQRLPRKLKKKYKKLGIYEDWKKESGLI